MQGNLFNDTEQISLPGGGELLFYRQWISASTCKVLFDDIIKSTPWEQPEITVGGKRHLTPRMQAWYGHKDAVLMYSGTRFIPSAYTPSLQKLRTRLIDEDIFKSNSVLVNLYRDQYDSVGWHADDEREFGLRPKIASLSLGASRRFQLKPKPHFNDSAHWHKGKRSLSFDLQDGDLLIMGEGVQENWLHSVPKESSKRSKRINLTFRWVVTADE